MEYIYEAIPIPKTRTRSPVLEKFRVLERHPDGSTRRLGEISHLWIGHLKQEGWSAELTDDDDKVIEHRAVHEHQWQATEALVWDGVGYPFPIIRRRRLTSR